MEVDETNPNGVTSDLIKESSSNVRLLFLLSYTIDGDLLNLFIMMSLFTHTAIVHA